MGAYRENLARIARDIEADNPGWHVWYVFRFVGGIVWCARNPAVTGTVSADTHDELSQLISKTVIPETGR